MRLHHLFIPHHKNNHRAKILHNTSLLALLVAVVFVSAITVVIHKTYPEVLGISYQISDAELLNLTNYERAQNGLAPLSLDSELSSAAKKKADHMFLHNYWAHFAPDGTSPWDFIRGEGYNYTYAGENLARGFTTSVDAVNAWMNSPTHKANILSANFKDVGFAIEEGNLLGGDTVLIVQEFGQRQNSAVTNPNALLPAAVNSAQSTEAAQQVKGSVQTQIPSGGQILPQSYSKKSVFDMSLIAKTLTFILLAALLTALVLDFIIIEKKKIPRSVGNNLDHVILITIFIAFLLMAKLGNVI